MAGSCSGRRQVLQVSLRGCILRSEVRPHGGEVWLTAHRCVPCPVEGVLEVGQAHRQTVFHPTMVAPRRGCSRPAHSHSNVHWPAGARGEQNSDPDDQSGERQPWAHSTARGHLSRRQWWVCRHRASPGGGRSRSSSSRCMVACSSPRLVGDTVVHLGL